MTLPMPSPQRRHALRRMKIGATGLLVAAAAVFVVCVTVGDGHGAWGWVEAAAEASMVGGLADWFAVTALFRHPLGIPIPHTAIIQRKKDQIGRGLGEFVQQHFLTGSVVGEHVAQAEIPRRTGEWLATPANAALVADEIAAALAGMSSFVRDDEIRAAVAAYADKRLREADVGPDLRRQFDQRLRDYADALRSDPAKAASIDAAKLQLLDHPEVRAWLST